MNWKNSKKFNWNSSVLSILKNVKITSCQSISFTIMINFVNTYLWIGKKKSKTTIGTGAAKVILYFTWISLFSKKYMDFSTTTKYWIETVHNAVTKLFVVLFAHNVLHAHTSLFIIYNVMFNIMTRMIRCCMVWNYYVDQESYLNWEQWILYN